MASPKTSAAAYEVLARRLRPRTFADVIGQEHVTRPLARSIETGRVAHAFVFSGIRGVGKTTTARILARALNCEHGPTPLPCGTCRPCLEISEGRSLDVLEVDAASQTGIDAARELLETVKYQPASNRFRIYIIDEAHGLSRQAVDAFLKTLEEPPPHAKFILATTAAQKLSATILSRCQRYDFRAVPTATIATALAAMVAGEKREAEPDALATLAREAGGSLRDATSLLEQALAWAEGPLRAADVRMALGLPDAEAASAMLERARTRDAAGALSLLDTAVRGGADLPRLTTELATQARHVALLAVGGKALLEDLGEAELARLAGLAADLSPETARRWFRILLSASDEIGRSGSPQMVLELALVDLATLPELRPLDEILERLESVAAGRPPRGPGGDGPAAPPRPASGGAAGAGTRAAARPAGMVPSPRESAGAPGAAPRALTSKSPGTGGTGLPEAAAQAPRRPVAASSEKPTAVVRAGQGANVSARTASTADEGTPTGRAEAGAAALPSATPPIPLSGGTSSGLAADQARWKGLVTTLTSRNAARFFRLSYSRLLGYDEAAGVVRVEVTGREAATALAEPVVAREIEEAIRREFGRELRFVAVPAEAAEGGSAPQSLDRAGREDPIVKLSVEVFSGHVEAVLPRTRREG